MERTYDIFEMFAEGAPLWRASVTGHEQAIAKLRELAATTKNEVQIRHIPTNSLVATMNAPKA